MDAPNIKEVHWKSRLHVSVNLLFKACPPLAWLCRLHHHCAYVPTSNVASHDHHEKINMWFPFLSYLNIVLCLEALRGTRALLKFYIKNRITLGNLSLWGQLLWTCSLFFNFQECSFTIVSSEFEFVNLLHVFIIKGCFKVAQSSFQQLDFDGWL